MLAVVFLMVLTHTEKAPVHEDPQLSEVNCPMNKDLILASNPTSSRNVIYYLLIQIGHESYAYLLLLSNPISLI